MGSRALEIEMNQILNEANIPAVGNVTLAERARVLLEAYKTERTVEEIIQERGWYATKQTQIPTVPDLPLQKPAVAGEAVVQRAEGKLAPSTIEEVIQENAEAMDMTDAEFAKAKAALDVKPPVVEAQAVVSTPKSGGLTSAKVPVGKKRATKKKAAKKK